MKIFVTFKKYFSGLSHGDRTRRNKKNVQIFFHESNLIIFINKGFFSSQQYIPMDKVRVEIPPESYCSA